MKRDGLRSAAVIGAGIGGLALAIRLQAGGIATTLFEKRDKPGGRAYVYEDQGFVFDAGPTVITDPGAIEALFTLAGRRMSDYVELLPVAPLYRLCWEDGDSFDYVNDQAELERQIALRSQRDVEGYRRFLAFARQAFQHGYVELGAVPFLSWRDMARAAPQIMRLGAWRSVYDAVASFIGDERLRQAFSFHSLLVGGNPFQASAIYSLIHALEREWGVWFARGGTGALIRALARLFEDLGGTLKLNAACDAIAVEGQRASGVRERGGALLPFDAVASNADVVHTYAQLLRDHPRGRDEGRRLSGKRFSMSLFVVHFGLRGAHPQLRHHTVCFGERYRELLKEVFGDCAQRLPADFSLYLHAPSVTDPSLAPPGHSAYYVLAPVPHLGHAAIDWESEAPRYRDRILDYLEKHYMPGLRADLVTCRTFSPQDFRSELNAHLGSAFSLEPLLSQSALFRPHNRDAQIANLYLVGAGTHPGAGIPGVLASAKATAGLMLGDALVPAPFATA
ncbi:MAG TPA: phytoene desaturase [Methylibium sp.]|uniref:phytoene desaturase n=1 Tax=Methylibium sp. TaxID=2067992 RepID=UPI002DBAEA73|nr:phytoene desaturase [Methylibium sp.]HEU4457854.1 phytoene desaturase [Methylibium sp.]